MKAISKLLVLTQQHYITWELVRDVNYQAPLRPIELGDRGPAISVLISTLMPPEIRGLLNYHSATSHLELPG